MGTLQFPDNIAVNLKLLWKSSLFLKKSLHYPNQLLEAPSLVGIGHRNRYDHSYSHCRDVEATGAEGAVPPTPRTSVPSCELVPPSLRPALLFQLGCQSSLDASSRKPTLPPGSLP